ncbi:DHHC palmitoyltransferase-domain-containing protein [Hyaloraphidium curvatum]|nr:DHHC palmitoyltransferase-domain-containing protein [Hyaloraphidium curvatum]
MLFIFLGSYLILLLLFVFIMLFGPTPTWKDTIVGTAYDFLTDGCFKIGDSVVRSCCGAGVADSIKGAGKWMWTSAHPLMAMFFLTLLTIGVVVFVKDGLPKLPNKNIGPFLTYTTVWPTIITVYASFFLAMFSSPGRVTPRNVHRALELYEYDHVLYSPRQCATCGLQKPARSKHCGLCKACVARQDHHCVWVNNCVGHNNHRYFLLFLLSTSWICSYGAFVVVQTLRSEMDRRNVAKFFFLDRDTGGRRRLTFSERWLWMLAEEPGLMGLSAFLVLAFIVVFLFFLYQLHLVLQNTTTNETAKWDEVREAMEGGKPLLVRRPIRKDGASAASDGNGAAADGSGDEAIGDVDAEWEQRELRSYDEVESLYNRGWWRNLMEVLFPEPLPE